MHYFSLFMFSILLALPVWAGDTPLSPKDRAAEIEQGLGLPGTESGVPGDVTASNKLAISGFTEAKSDIQIGLPEGGRIDRINVVEGQRVKAGEVLLVLDSALEELEVRHRRLQRDQHAELAFAVERETLLRQKYQSSKRLLDSGTAISRDEYDQARIDHAMAAADVTRLKSRKELEQVEYALDEEGLRRRTLQAPIDGVVVRLFKAETESVQAHEPLIRLVEATSGRFRGNAEFEMGNRLSVGQDVCVRIDLPGRQILRSATVTFLSPVIDTASNLMEVNAQFANDKDPVQLGGAAMLLLGSACK